MRNKLIFFISFICLCLQFSCVDHNDKILEIDLEQDTIIDQLSDSSFISDVRSMYYYNQKIYLTDYKRDQILILDEKARLIKSLGMKGKGPGEFLGASQIIVCNDTILVTNDAKQCIEVFDFYKHIKTILIPEHVIFRANHRFFIRDNCINMTSFKGNNSIVSFNISSDSLKYFGRSVKFASEQQTRIRNSRHIFSFNSSIIAVSDNMPIIEMYDFSGKLIELFDYSKVPEVKKMISYANSKKSGPNSYYQLVTDAYLNHGKLYLLLLSIDKDNRIFSNKVLEIELDKKKMSSECLYNLGNVWYSSFCIEDSFIWAFGQEGLVKFSLSN